MTRRKFTAIAAIGIFCCGSGFNLSAQTNKTAAANWLANAGGTPEFSPPKNLRAWEKRRTEIRGELWQMLGKLPPRPEVPKIETLSREDRDGFTLEKFQFDNGAGAIVPGYLLLPKNGAKKSPALLYCHWHGGQYDIGKEELFRTNATPVAPGAELAKRGFVVIAIDAYCFGDDATAIAIRFLNGPRPGAQLGTP